jgi:hypothetical protein
MTLEEEQWFKKPVTEQEFFEMDCMIIRALKSAEMHNWFVCMREFKMNGNELGKRADWIKEQGVEYRKRIDQFNEEKQKEEIRAYQRWVYASEKDETLKDWSKTKKYLCYDMPKKKLEDLGLYPVTDEVYERIIKEK